MTLKKYLIALDDGHGMETSGKRTPLFEDGTFMYENDFNKAVIEKLDKLLKHNGFDTLLVAPTDEDTPLKERTDLANKMKADFYFSCHANAYKGVWGDWGGQDTFYYGTDTYYSKESKRAAEIIHKHLIQGTKLRDRGVNKANFHVLRETNMPSVLSEMAFMDNKDEARLLMSDEYRKECGIEVAKGICEYFGVKFELPSGVDDMVEKTQIKVNLLGNETTFEGVFIDNKNYASIREVFEKMGFNVDWNTETQTIIITFKLK